MTIVQTGGLTIDANHAILRDSVFSVFMRHSRIIGHDRHTLFGVSFLFAIVTR
jgi:hypothetical protein